MKPISPTQHGIADYLFAASTLVLARRLPAGRNSRRLLHATTGGVLALGALTRYPLGLLKVVPMKAHVAVDLATDALLAAATLLLRAEDGKVKGAITGLAAAGTAVALLTRADGV